ncbi:MAG: riboflavin synthase [Rhodothermaceae bacterium]|nr:riboflavin synthase [Rhodothermaceae bacterium]MXZ57758.1 riboflavin synthase [Rhodothermaceae bacterium]MYB91730.1 riboflavin synthase [Rhodothermaceae bacterium]MYD67556.1 riboflavin synthase [Rhodothermaceae bacterium]MYG45537.1 riboflavin synthase [Rhodothermaceae bacterium]
MFTGLVEQVGQLTSSRTTPYGRELVIRAALSPELSVGQSIAVNGVCLSLTDHSPDTFTVLAVPETLSKTTLAELLPDTPVNLERALLANSRLDGHLVQGHIDTACTITSASIQEDKRIYEFLIPDEYFGLVVPRGSIALDGISLTIADLHESYISVAIIPQTYRHTNVSTWQPGMRCNVEFDILAQYVARQMAVQSKT